MSLGQHRRSLLEGRDRINHVDEYFDQLAYERDPIGGYRLCRNQRLPHITINEYGYRGKPFTGAETILLLGDSVTFGVGASNDDARFPEFLARYAGQPVADASVRAYRVFQHFAQLPRLLCHLPRTRLVVLWCGYTDLIFWATSGGCVEGALAFERKYGSGAWTALRPQLRWIGRVARPLAARLIRGGRGAEDRARERGTLDDLVVHMVTYITAIRDLCASRGIDVTVLIQPFLQAPPADPYLRTLADACDHKAREKCGVGWYEAAPEFTQRLRVALARQGSFDWIDCARFVTEGAFLDIVHMGESELERLAKRLIDTRELHGPGGDAGNGHTLGRRHHAKGVE